VTSSGSRPEVTSTRSSKVFVKQNKLLQNDSTKMLFKAKHFQVWQNSFFYLAQTRQSTSSRQSPSPSCNGRPRGRRQGRRGTRRPTRRCPRWAPFWSRWRTSCTSLDVGRRRRLSSAARRRRRWTPWSQSCLVMRRHMNRAKGCYCILRQMRRHLTNE